MLKKFLLALILLSAVYLGYLYFHKEKKVIAPITAPVVVPEVKQEKSIINVPDDAEGKG